MNTENYFISVRQFEWNIFPEHTTVEIMREIKTKMTVRKTRLEEFEDRIIFMSMFNDIDWIENGIYKECFSNSEMMQDYARKFPFGHWSFLGPGEEEKWYGTRRCHGCQFRRQPTSILQSFQCVGSEILEKERRAMYDSLQCGSF